MDDQQEFLNQFLLYGHVLTAEEIETAGEEGVLLNPPTLDQFREQVDNYEKIYEEVERFEVRKQTLFVTYYNAIVFYCRLLLFLAHGFQWIPDLSNKHSLISSNDGASCSNSTSYVM